MTNLSEDGAQEIISAWVHRVLAHKGWKPYRLAQEAGVGVATIDRAMNPKSASVTTTKTIEKIVRATGVAAPTGIGMRGNATAAGLGFAEPEAIYVGEPIAGVDLQAEGDQAIWQLKSRGIELAGYHFDDFLLVDPRVVPVARDAVCVQIYDLKSGKAETAFRVFDPPYVVTETADPAARRKPVAIDNERAGIWGVVVKSLRVRKG